MDTHTEEKHDPYSALREVSFVRFLLGNIASTIGGQMQTVAIGWQLYEQTSSAMVLGIVGLAQAIPILGLTPFTGHITDLVDRRKLLICSITLNALCSLTLAGVTYQGGRVSIIYTILFLNGITRAFIQPARAALIPQMVPSHIFPNAIRWSISGFELSSILGPAMGGAIIAWTGHSIPVYFCAVILSLTWVTTLFFLPQKSYKPIKTDFGNNHIKHKYSALKDLVGGFHYVWRNKILLSVMALDMFAVLFGGVSALLPIYAKDILHVGPSGLGWLQAAHAIGAISMALITTHLKPFKQAGRALLFAVGGYGLAMAVFGYSTYFPLSLFMLFLTGALDNISVVIRQTMAIVLTPDELRGRVSAVNGMFISASNELGRFESGTVAYLCGAVFSVISGGFAATGVVLIIALMSPQLRKFGRLDTHRT